MDNLEFNKQLINYANTLNIEVSEEQANKFYEYMKLLLDWNNKINLTAITDEKEIIIKHFIDSISINKYIKGQKNVMDIGTGAGFPGIPLKMINPDLNFTLVDSLNKRILFLEEVCCRMQLKQVECLHARAEELAKNGKYREQYDIVVSRAVARLATLLEYMLPFIRLGGKGICMKGSHSQEEVDEAQGALEVLGGEIEKVENIILPDSDMERNIIVIRKIRETPKQYPRKAGMASKQPIM